MDFVIANLEPEKRPKNVLCTGCEKAIWFTPGHSETVATLRGFCRAMGDFMYDEAEPIELQNCSAFEAME